jgi:hypothetical protein
MKALTCAATRRRLDAFHDRELPITDQIAVSAHLEWCDECAATYDSMRSVGVALRAVAPGRIASSMDEAAWFRAAVVNRLNAERDASMTARLRAAFEDLRLVYVGLSAAVAATVCLVVMMGMMRFATSSRPDSLAAILNVMATPFECETTSEVPDALACRARWVERFQRANESVEQDAVFTLDAIVIHDGRVANLAVLRASRRDASGQAEVIEELLDTVSRARSMTQPTELSGELVRMVTSETVRATKQAPNDLTLPAAAKPAGSKTARGSQAETLTRAAQRVIA